LLSNEEELIFRAQLGKIGKIGSRAQVTA